MRVAIINSVVDFGSTGKIVRQIGNSLISEGHEVLIAYGRNTSKDSSNTFYFGSKLHSAIHLICSRFLGRHALHSSIPTRKLIKKLEEFKPDTIHLHNLHGYYLHVPMLFKYLADNPQINVIWTLHDCWSVSGSSAYFSFNGCKVWDKGCVECNSTYDYPKSTFIRRQRKNFEWKQKSFTSIDKMILITPSYWLRDLIKETFLNIYPVEAIYNGIDLNVFKPNKTHDSETFHILGVSNIWEERKGLSDFIKLRAQLSDRYSMTLIGLSKDQIQNLPAGIEGIERTDNVQSLVEYYSNADVYLNLSVEETMGMTTIEAIACGTPAIVYDQTAVPEIVDPSVGIVVQANDIQALEIAVKSITPDKFPANILTNYACNFSELNMIEHYLEVYSRYEYNSRG